MNMLREVIGGAAQDVRRGRLAGGRNPGGGAVTGLLVQTSAVRPLTGGAFLFLGCGVVLLVSVVLSGRRHRFR